MEALGLHFSSINGLSVAQRLRGGNYLSGSALMPIATAQSFFTLKFHNNCRTATRMQVVEEEYEVKQMKDMAAARKRWEALLPWSMAWSIVLTWSPLAVRDGKVKILTPREAGYAIQLSNKTLLDVRPSSERQKAWVKGSTWAPIFDVDDRLDPGTISRKVTDFMMGGWWSGVPTLSYDKSLAACELLYNAGYENLFWIQGGLEAAEEEDLDRDGPQPFKLAGIGGLSEFLGWTDQQRAAAAKEGWGYRLVFSARLLKKGSLAGRSVSCCGCIVSWGTASGPLSPGLEISLRQAMQTLSTCNQRCKGFKVPEVLEANGSALFSFTDEGLKHRRSRGVEVDPKRAFIFSQPKFSLSHFKKSGPAKGYVPANTWSPLHNYQLKNRQEVRNELCRRAFAPPSFFSLNPRSLFPSICCASNSAVGRRRLKQFLAAFHAMDEKLAVSGVEDLGNTKIEFLFYGCLLFSKKFVVSKVWDIP
ncbi:UNVERIFIED_CONTAM: Rhodanese-like domain-containing protein 11, chloroplastic [Sesamum radiatum]|uniref:Rhodanese-like domain-containing protein 11, chloroplastic n=1 Tax=Sesamum radiatum TaxID=300843 RepID=A0AAW2WIA1_SESRA